MSSRSVSPRWLSVVGGIAAGCLAGASWAGDLSAEATGVVPVKAGEFAAEALQVFTTEQGLPDNDASSVLVTAQGQVFAGTSRGLARRVGDRWELAMDRPERVRGLAVHGAALLVVLGNELVEYQGATGGVTTLAELPEGLADAEQASLAVAGGKVFLGTGAGLFALEGRELAAVPEFRELTDAAVRQIASSADDELAAAAADGLFVRTATGEWRAVKARDGKRSWFPHDVRAVTYDRAGRLWFASAQGVGCRAGGQWSLYTGKEGLPYDDFTTCAGGEAGVAWFGTKIGAIRFDGSTWNYRQGRRWVPDDDVRSIAVEANGNAWIATSQGVGLIERRMMTLAQKAALFEEEIDRYLSLGLGPIT